MVSNQILGVSIGAGSLNALVGRSASAIILRRDSFIFACANPHSLIVAKSDPEFRDALASATAVVADGVGCQWAAWLSGCSVGPRITGFDYFFAVMASLNTSGGRAFLFGSSDEVLAKLLARIATDFPRVIAESLSPPYRPWLEAENDQMVEKIKMFNPDVLWVGMTAPKQEKWVARNCARLQVPVIGSIGAVFDYYAGVTPRAPKWYCDRGLEWLYRLPREPKRLWRRTLVSAPQFLAYVLWERIIRVVQR